MKQKINDNKNIIKLLKIKKIKIVKKNNIILQKLFFVSNRLIQINKAFFQHLDNLKNQISKIVTPINNDSSSEQNSSGYNSDDDSDIEVLSESEEENDNGNIYSKPSSNNFKRQLSDISEEDDIEITSSRKDSGFNKEDDSDIEVISESEDDGIAILSESKNSLLKFSSRYNSKDSGLGSELEHSVFNKDSINDLVRSIQIEHVLGGISNFNN